MSDDYTARISRDVQALMQQIDNTSDSARIAHLRTEIGLLTRTFCHEQQREITENAVPEILQVCGKYATRIIQFDYEYMACVNLAVLISTCSPKHLSDICSKFKNLSETFSESYFRDALYVLTIDAGNYKNDLLYKEISAGTIVWQNIPVEKEGDDT